MCLLSVDQDVSIVRAISKAVVKSATLRKGLSIGPLYGPDQFKLWVVCITKQTPLACKVHCPALRQPALPSLRSHTV